ncbi:MAG: hypothetical protein ABIK65_00960 [Candidatus Eisenbacteria bacterium]
MQGRFARFPIAAGFLTLLVISFAGCGDEGPTRVPITLDAPPRPTDLRADVEERRVTLDWDVPSAEGIASYRVYRSEGEAGEFILVGQPAGSSLVDSGLVPGRTYSYRVTALGSNGIESDPSSEVAVTPGSFGIVIDDRAEYTGTRSVTLLFTAPADVNAVKVGHDSLLTGAFYEAFEGSRGWILADGDGEKAVYARFRTGGGAESPVVGDRIILDRVARILSLVEDSEGATLGPGDTLRVTMITGEAGGEATVTIGTGIVGEPMAYDDLSGAYIYTRIVTPDLFATGEVAIGNFIDRAGNRAPSFATTTTVTFGDPGSAPVPVTLAAAGTGTNWIALEWTASGEIDFASYVVYRSGQPGITGGPGDFVVGLLSDAGVTGMVDSVGLRDTTAYYYRIFVRDAAGRTAGSNTVSAATRNAPPIGAGGFAAAALDSPLIDIRLTWNAVDASAVRDFAAYEIYRSTAEAVSRNSDLVGTVGEIGTRSFVDRTTAEATTYYYRLYVVDRGGLAASSETASAVTTDRDPSFVTLNAPSVDVTNQNVILTWDRNGDVDFAAYEIYWRSGSVGGVGSFSRLHVINNPATTGYVHYPEVTDLPLYVEYYLEVTDRTGNRTRSNSVQAVFPLQPQAPPGVEVVAGRTSAFVNVTTDVPTRVLVRYGTNSSSLNQTQTDSNLAHYHSVALSGLLEGTTYFVQVTVTDESGASTVAPVRTFTTTGGG